jgi:hypothetical protein
MTQANNVAIESSQINSSGVLLTAGGGTGLSTVGTNGQVLTSNGTTLSWVTPTTTSPGGSTTQVQYNSSGSFAGSANFVFDGTNVGIGVTPNASWAGSGYIALQIGQRGVLMSLGTGASVFNIGTNFYYDGSSYRYLTTDTATQYQQNSGAHNWRIAASGTAGNTLTWTQAMLLDSAGNVGIGTSSPKNNSNYTTLTLNNATNGGVVEFTNNNTTVTQLYNTSTAFNIYGYTNITMNLITSGTGVIALSTSGSERVRIDASGNVKLSTASTTIQNSSGRPMVNQTGGVLQVLQTVKSDTFSITTSSSWQDITGMSVTITPSSTSSTILVMADIAGNGVSQSATVRLVRNSTAIFTGNAASNRPLGSANWLDNSIYVVDVRTIVYLDSPATSSAVTYKLQVVGSGATWYLNRSSSDRDTTSYDPRTASSITVMEIAG